MYVLYILKSEKTPKSYVGITDNLERRLKEHNSGRHVYTKRHAPWTVIYTENHLNRQEARKREKYFKSTTGRRHMKKIFSELE